MTYLSLIHGATGMTYYTYGGHGKNHGATHDPRVWANLKRVAGELAQLQNVLVERDPGVKVACEVVAGPARDALGYPSISTMVRRHSGFTYLFTASSSAENVKARFRVPGLGQKVECLFEERALSPQGGLPEDSLSRMASTSIAGGIHEPQGRRRDPRPRTSGSRARPRRATRPPRATVSHRVERSGVR